MVEISIKEVLKHLENGVTRTVDSKNYNAELRSLEEIYSLSKGDIRDMFKHPLLMNKKTRPPRAFKLIDDMTADLKAAQQATEQPSTPSYGARPNAFERTVERKILGADNTNNVNQQEQ